jgi:hypothetical protein
MTAEEEFQYVISKGIPQLAVLADLATFAGKSVIIYGAPRGLDCRKCGLIRITDIVNIIEGYGVRVKVPNELITEHRKLAIDDFAEWFNNLRQPYVDIDGARGLLYYVSAKLIYDILNDKLQKRGIRRVYVNCTFQYVAPHDFDDLKVNLRFRKFLNRNEITTGKVPSPLLYWWDPCAMGYE